MNQPRSTDSKRIVFIIVLNLLGSFFYYSPISLFGYWSDALFLILVCLLSFFLIKRIDNPRVFNWLRAVFTINLLLVVFNSISIFNGVVSVHRLPTVQNGNDHTYGYFIERGNLGLTNGCYGEIQYHRQIEYLPFLEFNYETNECSDLDVKSLIK